MEDVLPFDEDVGGCDCSDGGSGLEYEVEFLEAVLAAEFSFRGMVVLRHLESTRNRSIPVVF